MDADEAAKTATAPNCPFCHYPQFGVLEHWELAQEDEFVYQCENTRCTKLFKVAVYLTPLFTAMAPSDDAGPKDED